MRVVVFHTVGHRSDPAHSPGAGGLGSSSLDFGRSIGKGEFPDEAFDAASRLQPHLIRAYRLGRKLAAGFGVSGDLALALEASSHALMIVDEDGRLRSANGVAERLLARNEGLKVLNGRLGACGGDSASGLRRLVSQATARQGSRSGGSLGISSPGQRFPLFVRVSPLSYEQMPIFAQSRLALVCATDLGTPVTAPDEQLRSLFGLTPAEGRLASELFTGLQLSEAAERLNVTINTVRSQLARVFDKVGVCRQADLVTLMMRLTIE